MTERIDGGRRVAMAFSGGIGLGAYQGGAYAAFHEAALRLDHIAGVSIGAVVDFDRLNGGEIRVSIVATDVETGEDVTFDTDPGDRIEAAHVMASCGFIPDFPPTEIGGRLLGDGALTANTPVDSVLMAEREKDVLAFIVDLYPRRDRRPRSLEAAATRRQDLFFSSPARESLKAHERESRLRAAIGRLAKRLPAEVRDDPEVAAILAEGDARAATILHLSYLAPADEAGPAKAFDFSRAALGERWRAGDLDMKEALRALAQEDDANGRKPGLRVHEVRRPD